MDKDIIPKTVMQFYLDGLETSTNLILPILFLIALNPDVQVRIMRRGRTQDEQVSHSGIKARREMGRVSIIFGVSAPPVMVYLDTLELQCLMITNSCRKI